MEQKLIFMDIDGTLTEPGKNVPPDSAVKAIRQARENGHRVVLCSGRNYGLLTPLLSLGFDGFISSAGGYIVYDGQEVYDCPMTPVQQEKVLTVLEKNGVYYTIETRDCSYTDDRFKEFLRACPFSGSNSELLRWKEIVESDQYTLPMEKYNNAPVYKLIFASRGMERLQVPMKVLQDEFYFCIQDTAAKAIINGDLINKAFNKGTAVQRLCDYLNFPQANTIAFGDSMNDLEMLQASALGICMENGSPALQKIADAICPSIQADGIYRAFERLKLL